jgi:hypothetical protein
MVGSFYSRSRQRARSAESRAGKATVRTSSRVAMQRSADARLAVGFASVTAVLRAQLRVFR